VSASLWALRTAIFALSVGAGLALANWAPGAMSNPVAASLPRHASSAAPAPSPPIATPTLTPGFAASASPATPTTGGSPLPTTATAVPVLAVPLATVPQTLHRQGMDLTLIVSPGLAGSNNVELFFFDAAGA